MATKESRPPKDVPAYLASLYEVSLLTREQEVHLFRKMNYLKFQASALRAQADWSRPKSRWMDRIEELYDAFVVTKHQIIRANLRLVVSIVKRYMGPAGNFFELVSDGNMSLIKAADRFDFSRGNRFSTYASWAIMRNFARSIPNAFRQRGRFYTGCPDMLSTVEDMCANHREQESEQVQRESHVEKTSRPTGYTGAAHRHESFWPHPRAAAAQVTANRGHDRHLQRTRPADPVSRNEKLRRAAREDRIEDLV